MRKFTPIKSVSIQCGHCGHKQKSGIFFGTLESLEATVTMGNAQQCVNCHRMFAMNKNNMSWVLADGSGGGMGPDYPDNKI